jgi:site-specific recombinase XerD
MHQLDKDSIQLEVVETKGGDQYRASGEVIGKGGKRRSFFVDVATMELLAIYIESRKDEHKALFLSERKERLSVRAMQYTLHALCKRSGVNPINVHRLRHSFATRLANAGINSMVLKELMWHSSFAVTQRYFKLSDTTVARAYHSAMEYMRP